jgi:Flp pilus assembly pilin Flp
MEWIIKLHIRADALARGQTMAEYALILAAVVVIVYAGYQSLGSTLTTTMSTINSTL